MNKMMIILYISKTLVIDENIKFDFLVFTKETYIHFNLTKENKHKNLYEYKDLLF
jgi:hypothetical protein